MLIKKNLNFNKICIYFLNNIFTELFITLGVIIFILCGISAGRSFWHMITKCVTGVKDESNNKKLTKRRVKALDTFRGYIIRYY